MTKPFQERRKHPRYGVTEETALVAAPRVVLSDNLIDISAGGLSFSYGEEVHFQVGERVEIEILRNDIAIEGIPATIVDDTKFPPDPRYLRRCGVQFGTLSELQKEKIAFLVEKFGPDKT